MRKINIRREYKENMEIVMSKWDSKVNIRVTGRIKKRTRHIQAEKWD